MGKAINGEAKNDIYLSFDAVLSNSNSLAVASIYLNESGFNPNCGRAKFLSIITSPSSVLCDFLVYPNPASDIVTIQLRDDAVLQKVNLYNVLGQLVKTESKQLINVSGLERGSYFIEVITTKGKATKKLIIK